MMASKLLVVVAAEADRVVAVVRASSAAEEVAVAEVVTEATASSEVVAVVEEVAGVTGNSEGAVAAAALEDVETVRLGVLLLLLLPHEVVVKV